MCGITNALPGCYQSALAHPGLALRVNADRCDQEIFLLKAYEGEVVTLQDCMNTWLGTLEHFGIKRALNPREELEIARNVQKYGAEYVELALYGARWEPKTETFDPKNFVSLRRVFGRDKQGFDLIDRFVNLGAPKRQHENHERARMESQSTAEGVERTDPARVREILAGAFRWLK